MPGPTPASAIDGSRTRVGGDREVVVEIARPPCASSLPGTTTTSCSGTPLHPGARTGGRARLPDAASPRASAKPGPPASSLRLDSVSRNTSARPGGGPRDRARGCAAAPTASVGIVAMIGVLSPAPGRSPAAPLRRTSPIRNTGLRSACRRAPPEHRAKKRRAGTCSPLPPTPRPRRPRHLEHGDPGVRRRRTSARLDRPRLPERSSQLRGRHPQAGCHLLRDGAAARPAPPRPPRSARRAGDIDPPPATPRTRTPSRSAPRRRACAGGVEARTRVGSCRSPHHPPPCAPRSASASPWAWPGQGAPVTVRVASARSSPIRHLRHVHSLRCRPPAGPVRRRPRGAEGSRRTAGPETKSVSRSGNGWR